MKKLIALIALLTVSTTFSQYYTTYDWETNPEIHTLNALENDESSVGVLIRKVIEFKQSEATSPMWCLVSGDFII